MAKRAVPSLLVGSHLFEIVPQWTTYAIPSSLQLGFRALFLRTIQAAETSLARAYRTGRLWPKAELATAHWNVRSMSTNGLKSDRL